MTATHKATVNMQPQFFQLRYHNGALVEASFSLEHLKQYIQALNMKMLTFKFQDVQIFS